MKILWVEDKNDILTSGVFENEYFNSYLSKKERMELRTLKSGNFKKVKRFLKYAQNKILLVSNFPDAMEAIENNTPFDKIILDINFPIENFDLNKYLKGSFIGSKEDYNDFISNIKDEFAGILLNHIIVTKYKEEFDWDKKDILSKIVFLSGNGIKFNDFDKRINGMYLQSFKYDTDASQIDFFDKKKDEYTFFKWLKEDEYIIILDRYLKNKDAKKQSIKRFKELRNLVEGDNFDKTIDDYLSMARKIQENLLQVIPGFENNRGVSEILKELHPKNGEQYLTDRYYHLGNMIQRVTSKNSHEYLEEDHNMLKSVIYALFSMIKKIDEIIVKIK
jgi:CheY-like chemotaxis protein